MAKRYEQLLPLIDTHKPRRIIEVGVHRAMRSMSMVERAFMHQAEVQYTGYDVFETESLAFQEEALNGKGMPTLKMAEDRMKSLVKRFPAFTYKLKVGDTRKTLHEKGAFADFAFIDGDHRVDVIRGDAQALDCPVLVFDDYYRPGPDGALPDLARYGANAVVDEFDQAGWTVNILPAADLCKHGGVSHLAVLTR